MVPQKAPPSFKRAQNNKKGGDPTKQALDHDFNDWAKYLRRKEPFVCGGRQRKMREREERAKNQPMASQSVAQFFRAGCCAVPIGNCATQTRGCCGIGRNCGGNINGFLRGNT